MLLCIDCFETLQRVATWYEDVLISFFFYLSVKLSHCFSCSYFVKILPEKSWLTKDNGYFVKSIPPTALH